MNVNWRTNFIFFKFVVYQCLRLHIFHHKVEKCRTNDLEGRLYIKKLLLLHTTTSFEFPITTFQNYLLKAKTVKESRGFA